MYEQLTTTEMNCKPEMNFKPEMNAQNKKWKKNIYLK